MFNLKMIVLSRKLFFFKILIDQKLFIEFIESNEEITRHDNKN